MWISDFELRKLARGKADDFGLLGGKLDGLRDGNTGKICFECNFDRVVSGVSELGRKGDVGRFVVGAELWLDVRMTQGDVAAGGKKDFAPHASVFIRWRGIPVDPS